MFYVLDLIKNSKNSNIVKYDYNLKELFSILIFSCVLKAEFSAFFSVTWSFWNHSNMPILCSRTLIILINVKTKPWYIFLY